MRRIWVLLFLCLAVVVNAQNKTDLSGIKKLTFMGVDFSAVRVAGATETASQFMGVFPRIIDLFAKEPKKYNASKAFRREATNDLAPSLQAIERIDSSRLLSNSNDYQLSAAEIAGQIKLLDINQAEGYGAILVAELFDKKEAKATYEAVIFDIKTREILFCQQVSGSAKGFGLRNYWANPMKKAFSQVRKSLK